jgi:hypothetical protein
MKYHLLTLVFLLILTVGKLSGQQSTIPDNESSIDLSIGLGKDLFSGAAAWNRTHGVSGSNKFRLGYGVRASLLSGKNLAYTTAPAKLAADLSKVDTLNVAKASTMALNAVINIQYKMSNKLALGFNIDAIGVGLGSETNAKFVSSDIKTSPTQVSKPTSVNLLLVGNNDKGQLKSEVYAEYSPTEHLGMRVGLDLTFSEYTTATILTQNNDRFRYKANLVFVGVSYKL